MDLTSLHPREQIVAAIDRIYKHGMTTTSGGNLSVRDEEGSLWITPKAIDKGALTPADIVCVRPDGSVVGRHEPSSEYPFHDAVYRARPDVTAIVHAHPPSLAAFAITRIVPDTRILPGAYELCGRVGYAPYVLPGSRELGEAMARIFSEGFSSVLMENHGIVTAGGGMQLAFERLEALERCAHTELNARLLGGAHALGESELASAQQRPQFDAWTKDESVPEAKVHAMAAEMIRFLRRCSAQNLMSSAQGSCSARVDERTVLVTPERVDRAVVEADDLVLVRDGKTEAGKLPDREAGLHLEIYRAHPGVNAVLVAQPPHIMAFAVSGAEFDSRTIPESYLVLKSVVSVAYPMRSESGLDAERVASRISERSPVVLCRNHSVVATGGSLLQCFDRMEVAEFSARAMIASKAIGAVVPIGAPEIAELERTFRM